MSLESLVISRQNASKELIQLANDHIQHDLQQSDRDALNKAAHKLSSYASIGSITGLGLGIALALRVRRIRADYFKTFRAMEKPTHLKFADGRTEPLPDLTSLLRPSRWGDVAASIFFSAGGLFIGGESGLLIGSYSAQHTIMRDDKSNNRIKDAFRKFRIDVLKRDLARLESNTTVGPDERGHLGGIF